MKTKFRLLPTVLICVGALILFSAGSIFVLNLINSRAIVSELTSRSVVLGLDGLELSLRAHLDAAKHQANFIARAIRSGRLKFDQPQKLAEFAVGSLAAAPQINGLLVASAHGPAIAISRTTSGDLTSSWMDLASDPQLGQLATETKERRQPYWGGPIYRDQSKTTLLNLRVPIWQDDTYLGFVAVGISTQALSQFALELSEPPHSTVFVLYGPDKVLAHMFLALKPEGLSVDKPLLGANEIIDPVIAHLARARPFRSSGFTAPKGIDALQLEISGDQYLVFKKTVAGYGSVPLQVGAYSVASTIDAPFRELYRTILISAGILALAMVLAVVMSRAITRSVREMSEGTEAIAALDFDKVRPLPQSRIKEIDDLSHSFNAMLVGLRSFGRYVPRALVKRLIRENSVGAGTEERELTVMFTDIVGFTTICDGLSPSEVATFINQHLTLVSQCIEREDGTIDKYIGDSVMAFWGAPDEIEDAPIRAGRAALAIMHALKIDNEKRIAQARPPVRMRIGIHSGPLIVGDIGTPDRINYTVVGDVVNTAQRLEALGKEVDPDAEAIVLISQNTKDALDNSFKVNQIGRFKMKGKRKEIEAYQLVA